MISVIIPALDEEGSLPETIRSCRRGGACEVVVADGGSADRTPEIAEKLADATIAAPRGRARQMNAGAAVANGTTLLFLHADTLLPTGAIDAVQEAMKDAAVVGGAFRIRLSASPGAGACTRAALRLIGWGVRVRSRITRSYTGDQAIFVRAEPFRASGGFPEIPLMEDVEASRWMARRGKTVLLPLAVRSSGRRWEAWGPAATVLLMWRLRVGYRFGMSAEECARRYRTGPSFLRRRRPVPPT
ncbi:MAG: TIGR04283 family arsenosugar biosynthesis glycosyltransferase [Verrucomicrobiota bacterium]